MARRRNHFLQSLVAHATILFVSALGRLPLPVARRIACGLAHAAIHLVPRIRKTGLANLTLAYGDALTPAEKKRILRKAVENLAIVAAEFARIPQLKGAFLERHVLVKGTEHLKSGQGVIVICAHLGNWEWMAPTIANSGYLAAAISRPPDNPRLDAYVEALRHSGDFVTIPKDQAAAEVPERLAQHYLVGVMVDQSPRENAVPVRFFGQPCWGTIGAALLASRSGAPVHAASMTRRNDGRYVLEFTPEIAMVRTGNSQRDLVENSQRCQDVVEAIIRAHPEQWLWLHRRWKSRPRLEQEWQERIRRNEERAPRKD